MAKNYTNQHIVPKRYLDRFGTKNGKRIIIGTRIVTKGKIKFFTDSTENVGYIKNYYDVTDKKDPKYWEHFFAREIDSICGMDMENIIARVMLSRKNAIVLSKQDKAILAKVIVAQLMRIPYSVEYVTDQLFPKVAKQVKDEVASSLPKFLLKKYGRLLKNMEFSEQHQKELLLNHTFAPVNFERYCGVLEEGIWLLYTNVHRNTMPFLTSDNPVLVEGIGNKYIGMFHNGLANPATCIFYPLSPGIAVAIYSRQGFLGVATDEYDGRAVLLDDVKYIMSRNIKIIDQAYRHSFIPQPLYDVVNNSSV